MSYSTPQNDPFVSPNAFTEINFPPKEPADKGYVHNEPKNGVSYIWDGVKWDPLHDHGNQRRDLWTRIVPREILHPTDTDDSILVSGIKDEWIEKLPDINTP